VRTLIVDSAEFPDRVQFNTHAAKSLRAVQAAPEGRGVPIKKTRRDGSRRVPTFVLAGPGAESAPLQSLKIRLAGDPSEVTALGERHWITSFRC
jgi:hypothetical protein